MYRDSWWWNTLAHHDMPRLMHGIPSSERHMVERLSLE